MSRFRFPLENVLSWRQTQLSLAEGELGVVRSERNRLVEALDDLSSQELIETESLRSDRSLQGSDLAALASARRWVQEERKRLQSQLSDCNRRLELKMSAVREAQRGVRLLDRLKEQREATWKHEQNRALEELAAESAIASWRRELEAAAG